MARISTHAKERLRERFGLSQDQIGEFGNAINQIGQYRLIQRKDNMEVREVNLFGAAIQGVVRNNVIVTCTIDTMLADNESVEINSLNNKIIELKRVVKEYKNTELSRVRDPFVLSFVSLLRDRMEYRKKIKERDSA
ncbi:MAG: hypothetical protein PQJ59_16900 [Spirochaetales bacterium]|nr:hypothetical protein [Spirochaetales bacterium]